MAGGNTRWLPPATGSPSAAAGALGCPMNALHILPGPTLILFIQSLPSVQCPDKVVIWQALDVWPHQSAHCQENLSSRLSGLAWRTLKSGSQTMLSSDANPDTTASATTRCPPSRARTTSSTAPPLITCTMYSGTLIYSASRNARAVPSSYTRSAIGVLDIQANNASIVACSK